MRYCAHTREGTDREQWQTIREHAENVARTVCDFSRSWSSEFFAWNLGLLHDAGKYQSDFQRRLEGVQIAVEHSVCGAVEAMSGVGGLGDAGAYCIAGHHSGLPDIGTTSDTGETSTLLGRLNRKTQDYSAYREELVLRPHTGTGWRIPLATQKDYAFWIRMMYSCLTDADYLDTERFCTGGNERGVDADFSLCLRQLEAKLEQFPADTPTAAARAALQAQVMSHREEDAQIYFMNMPTGSGKTLASMRFALFRALRSEKKRIIYVIPFTSIIEQNARVFKELFGEDCVLEHHSNFDYEGVEDETTREKLRCSAENWDASVVVTTNVQFFESIYDNQSSRLRKLHNMADSILVFDEVHMFSSKFYQPCLEAIKTLVQLYNCEALFLTATMPDFSVWMREFGCEGPRTLDLIQDKSCFGAFSRCQIRNRGSISLETLCYEAALAQSCLIVVNSRKSARKIYEALSGCKYHLSTYMAHDDRDRTIRTVKEKLASGEQVILVSTSLIEAGVDLDFETAYRELVGLDNLLQTAGRCNREGRRKGSVTYSFELEGEHTDPKFKDRRFLCNRVFEKFPDVRSPEAVTFYFDNLYGYQKNEMSSMDFAREIHPMKNGYGFGFASYARKFRLIDEDTQSVIAVKGETREEIYALLDLVRFGDYRAKRKLQRFAVNLRPHELRFFMEAGVLAEVCGVFVLTNERYYSPDVGMLFDENGEYLF